MLNLAQVGSVLCVVSLVLAFNSGGADAGISTFCIAADGNTTSLLVQVKKKKKHHDGNGQSHDDSGLTECTIQSAGGGGGCKSGFNYKCEKMKSGKKCCGCVAAKGTDGSAPAKDSISLDDVLTTKKGTDASQPEKQAPGTDDTFYGRYQSGTPPPP